MTCGIYRLTFDSGNFYIGKSTNIEQRWKQHADKMANGTHSKLMQQEYNMWGFPTGTLEVECHEDHIDILEETIIYRMRPYLNSTQGRDRLNVPFSKSEHIGGMNVVELLQMSTLDHISEILRLRKLVN